MLSRVPLAIFALAAQIVAFGLFCPGAYAEDDIAEALEAVNRQLQASPNDPRLLVNRSRLLALAKDSMQPLAISIRQIESNLCRKSTEKRLTFT